MERMNVTKGCLIVGILLFMTIVPAAAKINNDQLTRNLQNKSYSGTTLYVGGSGPGNYSRIQDAIDNASEGYTVFVYDDSSPYDEPLTINKTIMLVGENKETTVINGGHAYGAISINSDANAVIITGFTITNGAIGVFIFGPSSNHIIRENIITNHGNYGISLTLATHVHIKNNKISNGLHGIRACGSSSDIIISGNIVENVEYGVSLWGVINPTITDNIFQFCGINFNEYSYEAWSTVFMENNTVNNKPVQFYKNEYDITIPSNAGQVFLINCHRCILENLDLSSVDAGIYLAGSTNNMIQGNKIKMTKYGIVLDSNSDNNTLIKNVFSKNWKAMTIETSNNNTISYNIIAGNGLSPDQGCGIHFQYCYTGNTVAHNNFLCNLGRTVSFENSVTTWSHNYWGRPRLIPKPILGRIALPHEPPHHYFEFDQQPALLPQLKIR